MKNISAKQDKIIKTIVTMILFAILVIGLYMLVTAKANKNEEDSRPKTEAEKIISKDLELHYPASPREVVRLYSRIAKTFYNSEIKEEQLKELESQARKLFDYEFLANNPENTYHETLKKEIEEYKKAKRVIINYAIQTNSTIEIKKIKGIEYATVDVAYSLKEKSAVAKVTEKYMLRKDTDEKWKILGWKVEENPQDMEAE